MTTKQMRITVDGKSYDVTVEVLDDGAGTAPVLPAARPTATSAPAQAAAPATSASPSAAPVKAAATGGPGAIPSPMAGTVVGVEAKVGQAVKSGDTLVNLESMKMISPVVSPREGTVSEVHVAAGDAVAEGQPLITLSD